MRKIGLLGGMSWESTAKYYRLLNEGVRDRLGGLHNADCVLVAVDFAKVEGLQREERWEEIWSYLAEESQRIERAGAEFVAICCNTVHKVAEQLQLSLEIPLLHITDAVAEELMQAGISKVGLIGTRITMEEEFYRGRLQDKHGIDVVIPTTEERKWIQRLIFKKMCVGKFEGEDREETCRIIESMAGKGASGAILGCTEFGILLEEATPSIPLFDSTSCHVNAILNAALEG